MNLPKKIYWILLLFIVIFVIFELYQYYNRQDEAFNNFGNCSGASLPGNLNLENAYYILNIFDSNPTIYDPLVAGQLISVVDVNTAAVNTIYSAISVSNSQYEGNPLYVFSPIAPATDAATQLTQLTSLHNSIICHYDKLPFSFPNAANVFSLKISGGSGPLNLAQILLLDSKGNYIDMGNYTITATATDSVGVSNNASPTKNTNTDGYKQYYNTNQAGGAGGWSPISLRNSGGDGVWDNTDNSSYTTSITKYMATTKYTTVHIMIPNSVAQIKDDFIIQRALELYPEFNTYCGTSPLNMSMITKEALDGIELASQQAAEQATIYKIKCNNVISQIQTDSTILDLVSTEKSWTATVPSSYRSDPQPNENSTVWISSAAKAAWTITFGAPIQLGTMVVFSASDHPASIQGYVVHALDQNRRVLGTSPPMTGSAIQAINASAFIRHLNYGSATSVSLP